MTCPLQTSLTKDYDIMMIVWTKCSRHPQLTSYCIFCFKNKQKTNAMIFRLDVMILSLPLNPVLEECEFSEFQVS